MATKTKSGFEVTCPYCHETPLSIDLNDLLTITCGGCDDTFSPHQARDLAAAELARWERVVAWVELAATIQGHPVNPRVINNEVGPAGGRHRRPRVGHQFSGPPKGRSTMTMLPVPAPRSEIALLPA